MTKTSTSIVGTAKIPFTIKMSTTLKDMSNNRDIYGSSLKRDNNRCRNSRTLQFSKNGRLELADCGANQRNEIDEAGPKSSAGTYQFDYLALEIVDYNNHAHT